MTAVLPSFTSEVETAPYTPEAWSAIVADLGGRVASSLTIFGPEAEDPTRGRLSVSSATLDGTWVSLLVQAVVDWHDANDAGYCTRWVDFLAATLDQANPAFGVVTDDNLVDATAVDMVLHRKYKRSLDDSRRFLRGYGFATVVPAELVDRLGGVRELADTGAFVRVQPLRAGGVVLQATATLPQYDDEAMRRVFRALAPVLPPGVPRLVPGYEHVRVVYEDAHPGTFE
jgi:hypothetical protein